MAKFFLTFYSKKAKYSTRIFCTVSDSGISLWFRYKLSHNNATSKTPYFEFWECFRSAWYLLLPLILYRWKYATLLHREVLVSLLVSFQGGTTLARCIGVALSFGPAERWSFVVMRRWQTRNLCKHLCDCVDVYIRITDWRVSHTALAQCTKWVLRGIRCKTRPKQQVCDSNAQLVTWFGNSLRFYPSVS